MGGVGRRPERVTPLPASSINEQQAFFHDVLQSLTTVSLLTSALELELAGHLPDGLPADTRRRLTFLREEVGSLQELARSVLDREPRPVLEAVALDEVVASACAVFAETQPTDVLITTKRALVTAQRADLRRVVSNLLQNAFAAAGDHGTVVIDVRPIKDRAVFQVSDSGPGFGNLRREGSRFGLSVVRSIVGRLGGSLTLGTGAAGGAAVTVVLPRTIGNHGIEQRRERLLLDLVGGDG